MTAIPTYPLERITHIWNVDHPESISVGLHGEAYTTGTGGQVYRIHLDTNRVEQFASTAPRRMLGQALDADGNLYCADANAGQVVRISPAGEETIYATGPGGQPFVCTNYPAFDRAGNLYVSDSGDWSDSKTGFLYKIQSGGGEAVLWFAEQLDTPNAIALDAEQTYLYFIETWGAAIARIAIRPDGSAGAYERVVHLPRHVPDGLALDEDGRIWIAFHRPDAVKVFDPYANRLETLAEDWRGRELRGPTDVAFAGTGRDILLATSLDNLCLHRFDNIGVRGLKLNYPRI